MINLGAARVKYSSTESLARRHLLFLCWRGERFELRSTRVMFARNKKGALIREPGGLLSTAVGAQVLDY